MKRQRIDLADIAAYDNLLLATWKAAQGKRTRPEISHFLGDLERNLGQLARDILQGQVPYGHFRQFTIHDPKLRVIHAACFADRVLHHAVMNLAAPVIERTLVPSSFACRPQKGVNKAVQQVQSNMQRYPWYVKVDIQRYFPSIDHACLLKLLACRYKGQAFLNLLARIVTGYHTQPGKGLPIGSLTSQHFANYYLDGADRCLLQHPLVCAQVRYMDDTLWWTQDKASAKQVLADYQAFCHDERYLTLKPNVQINCSARGLSFCGYRILLGKVRLSLRKKRRYQQLRQQWESRYLAGEISSRQLQQGYAAVHAITLHADSRAWRKRQLQIHPSAIIKAVG